MAMWTLLFIVAGILALVLYNAISWPGVGGGSGETLPDSLSVLIPARNEEPSISLAVETLLKQDQVPLEILVYDDHSKDRTADVVRGISARFPKVRLLLPVELPFGWCGKSFACAHLAAEARGDWLLFLDADARVRPGALGRMLAEAKRRDVSFLSFWPGLELQGFWEKLFMPMLNFVVFTLFPAPVSLRMDWPSLGLAHGACLLMRRDVYQKTGGHALVRNELFEDTALARAWRARGEKGICLDGQDVVRVRMYDSLAGIWAGFQKNSYPAFRHEISFWLFLLFHAGLFVLPFGLAIWSRLALAAAGLVVLMRLAQAVRFRYPFWPAFLHPVAELGLLAVALRSWYRCRLGGGVEWKGRSYRGRSGKVI